MKIISGKEIASSIYDELKVKIQYLKTLNIIPGLAVVLVGERIDSQTYVNMKVKKCMELGIISRQVKFESDVSEETLLHSIQELNADSKIHGILVQLPLPKHLDEHKILSQISLAKDIDGFHCANIGKLALNRNPSFVPCTPKGCVELLKRTGIEIQGKNVVILGRSNIVGLPLSLLLLHENATVTICHSKTENIKSYTQNADILIAACGRIEMVKGDWIKKGCTIIDVGINSKDDPTKKRGYRLVGDVDFDSVKEKVGYITPVPGGVGPMTIAMLMSQTVDAASHHNS